MTKINHESNFSWQPQYLVRLEGNICYPAQCKYVWLSVRIFLLHSFPRTLLVLCVLGGCASPVSTPGFLYLPFLVKKNGFVWWGVVDVTVPPQSGLGQGNSNVELLVGLQNLLSDAVEASHHDGRIRKCHAHLHCSSFPPQPPPQTRKSSRQSRCFLELLEGFPNSSG